MLATTKIYIPIPVLLLDLIVEHGNATKRMKNIMLSNIDTRQVFEILNVAETGLISEKDSYFLGTDFSGFSGTLQRADEVDIFTVSVYDKNQLLIYFSEIKPLENWSINDIGLVYGYNRVVFEAIIDTQSHKKELTINNTTSMYFDKLDVDWSDTDGDGLPNYLECYFGTALDVSDSDNDGLTDFQELYYFGYEVLAEDSDNNGVCDCDEDADNDELSNLKEFEIGTDPLDNDSDNDKLLDGEELQLGTSPIMEDTDNDSINDYDEFKLTTMNALFNAENGMYTAVFSANTMDIDYDKTVIPSVTLTADAEGILSFNIQRVESNYLLNPSMKGYIGAAYEFTTDGIMESAELTFTYDQTLIDSEKITSPNFCPTIYYYNSEEGIIEEVEGQVWIGNQVTVNLSHFSTYILADKNDLETFWQETMEVKDETNLVTCNHVVFVMDKSGSMASNDSSNIRASLLKAFCSRLGKNDKIGLIGFSDYAVKYTQTVSNDKNVINNAILAFESQEDYGNTYLNDALRLASTMLQSTNDDNAKKSIFVLTDGITMDHVMPSFLQALNEAGISIYSVGLGNVSASYLQNIADSTNGKYFYAKTSFDLTDVFTDFEDTITDYDLNKDGLSDELTKEICQGHISTFTGTKVFCAEKDEETWEETYNELMKNDDYDGDGLKNGEEIGVFKLFGKYFICFNSSPEIIDTDCDGYSDYEEVSDLNTSPTVPNYIIDSADYRYITNLLNFESGKAYEDYVQSNGFGIFMEYYVDALFCGGKWRLSERTRRDLLSFFQHDLQVNESNLSTAALFQLTNNFVNGICDLLPFAELGKERIQVTRTINMLQTEIILSRKQPYSKVYRQQLLKAINGYKGDFKSYFTKILQNGSDSKLSNIGQYTGIALAILSCATDNFVDSTEYYAGLKVAQNYMDILTELQYCGNSNVESAAQTVLKDLEGVFSKYGTAMTDSTFNLIQYVETVGGSIAITSMFGIPGLIFDLTWIISGVAVGDALSTRLENGLSVELAYEINHATEQILGDIRYIPSTNGNINVVSSGKKKIAKANRFWLINTEAKKWCEEKYISYLEDERLFMDKDYFLYKTPESHENAQKNISLLSALYNKYTIN